VRAEPQLRDDARGEQQRRGADRHVDEEDVLPAGVLGQQAAGDHADRRSGRSDGTPQPERLVALGALGEHVHHDRQRRWQDHGRAEPLQAAHRDQEAVVCGQACAQRCGGEHGQAQHQDPPPPEQVCRATAEEQEAAEGDRVGGHDPLQVRFGDVECAADGWQRDVHDREIDDRHEERYGQDRERAPAADLRHRLRERRGRAPVICEHGYLPVSFWLRGSPSPVLIRAGGKSHRPFER